MKLTGIEYCKWNNGVAWVEQRGLAGECDKCKYSGYVGIYRLCFAGLYHHAHITLSDIVVLSLASKENEKRRCSFCKRHFRIKSRICGEYVNTPNLVKFKPYDDLPEVFREERNLGDKS